MDSSSLPIGPHPSLARPPADFRNPAFRKVDNKRYISFYHPGYSVLRGGAPTASSNRTLSGDADAELIRLPAYDNGAFHHGTALAACSIIACNRLGYFTTDTPDGPRVNEHPDFQLAADHRYYYHLDPPSGDPCYPICPSFTDWTFTPTSIPPFWLTSFNAPADESMAAITPSNMSAAVHGRDRICRVTGAVDITENAHIVPQSEVEWFIKNQMHHYNSMLQTGGTSVIHDIANGVLLRRDIHYAFDKRLFTPVVKEGKFVCHFLLRTSELAEMYHNAEFRLPEANRCLEFWWARFAWSVLGLIQEPGKKRVCNRYSEVVDVTSVEQEQSDHETPKPKKRMQKAPKRKRGKGKGNSAMADNISTCKKTKVYKKGNQQLDGTSKMQDTDGPMEHCEVATYASLAQENGKSLDLTGLEEDNSPSYQLEPNDTDSDCNTRCNRYNQQPPLSPPPSPSPKEIARDMSLKARLFPLMNEDTEWSNSYTWQFANWYPGKERTERLKKWYLEKNPHVRMRRDLLGLHSPRQQH